MSLLWLLKLFLTMLSFLFFEIGSHYASLAELEPPCRSGWPENHRDHLIIPPEC